MVKLVFHNMKINNKQKNKGFTLVEVLVATFIFTSIMMVSMSSLMATMSASRKARALRIAMDNVNFAMESMARSIRMGNYYYCDDNVENVMLEGNKEEIKDCPPFGKNKIAFLADELSDTTKTAYYLSGESLFRRNAGQTDGVSVTSSEIKVKELRFIVEGAPIEDNIQPRVYIIMRGVVIAGGEEHSFALQTLASRRRYE